jgi:hypothetical protein
MSRKNKSTTSRRSSEKRTALDGEEKDNSSEASELQPSAQSSDNSHTSNAGRKRRRSGNADVRANDLQDINEVGRSAKRQTQSSLKIFDKFITFSGDLPSFESDEFKNAFRSSHLGKYASYLIDVEGFTQNTALCYISNAKGRLKEKGIEIMDPREYGRLRGQIKRKSEEVSRIEGRKSTKCADPISIEDLFKICQFLLQCGDYDSLVARALIILQFQVMGRISECTQTVLSDLHFNSRMGALEIDWARSKTAATAKYNIFVEAMHFERDFFHALASMLLMKDHIDLKLFATIPDSPAQYLNNLLKSICEQLQIEKDIKSHSSRRGASTHAASDPQIQPHWIAERGSWLLDSINRAFLYIQSTTTNDARVARSLSCWKDVSSGGFPPKLPSTITESQRLDICGSLFQTAAASLDLNLMNGLAASLLMYLDDCKDQNIAIYETILERFESLGFSNSACLALGKEIKLNFVTENFLYFPKESPLLQTPGAQQALKIDISEIQTYLESSVNIQANTLNCKCMVKNR